MSARDYADFLARLKRDFPGESFLLVRFGDHQPEFAERIIDPSLDEAGIARRAQADDPRYFTTYYAIDAVNFRPVDLSSALDTLEAPYLPLVVQEAAGLPLDPSFVEQKSILRRCDGAFYLCNGGAEAQPLQPIADRRRPDQESLTRGAEMSTISRAADRLTSPQPLFGVSRLRLAVIGVLHVAALVILWQTEYELFHAALFVLAWGLFNCVWLVVLRRPGAVGGAVAGHGVRLDPALAIQDRVSRGWRSASSIS